jgi:hypothetical protein
MLAPDAGPEEMRVGKVDVEGSSALLLKVCPQKLKPPQRTHAPPKSVLSAANIES